MLCFVSATPYVVFCECYFVVCTSHNVYHSLVFKKGKRFFSDNILMVTQQKAKLAINAFHSLLYDVI